MKIAISLILKFKLKDKISRNDYNEVVNQGGRNWLFNENIPPGRPQSKPRLTTLDDCLKQFNQEKSIHSSINLRIKGELFRLETIRGKKGMSEQKDGKAFKRLLHNTKGFIKNKTKNKFKVVKMEKDLEGFICLIKIII